MPINRATPRSPRKDSESDVCLSSTAATDTENEENHNFTSRPRSRKRGHDDEWNNSMAEIRKIITELKTEQNGKLDELQATINDIRKQNAGIIESVEYLAKEYRDLKSQVEHIEKERKDNLDYIQMLENRIHFLEKIQKSSCIEIKNIPTKQKESKQDLLGIVNQVGSAINFPVQSINVRDVFRVNTKTDDNKPIIVEFTSVLTKESVLEHCKKFNNQHKHIKLNTSHLRISGPPRNIYISEHLTPKTRRLFFLTRDFANTYDYKYCWTAGGKVFLRKREGERSLRINSEPDLAILKAEQNV